MRFVTSVTWCFFLCLLMLVLGSPVAVRRLTDLSVDVISEIIEYLTNLDELAGTCRLFWNTISIHLLARLYNLRLSRNFSIQEKFLIEPTVGSNVGSLLSAFGNPLRKIDFDSIARNLDIFLQSPAFRQVFATSYWPRIRENEVFKQQGEQLTMFLNDLPRPLWRKFDHSLMRSLHSRLHVFAALPKDPKILKAFLDDNPFPLWNPEGEEIFFHVLKRLANRLRLLPVQDLLKKYLHYFAFDSRLIALLVEDLIRQRTFLGLLRMMRYEFPRFYRIGGHVYHGCVDHDHLVAALKEHLNSLESMLIGGIIKIVSKYSPEMQIYKNPSVAISCSVQVRFHALLLNKRWDELRELLADEEVLEELLVEDFEFLIHLDSQLLTAALLECPVIARMRPLLLDTRFQHHYFSKFTVLKPLRYALKAEIQQPDVISAHIRYVEDHQPRLYETLVADSGDRINEYFAMKLDSKARKHYKDHPSFCIAVASIDNILEVRLREAFQAHEFADKETVLRRFLRKLSILPDDLRDYFELAHTLPSFKSAMLPFPALDSQSQLVSNTIADLTEVVGAFSIHRIISDGQQMRYDFLLRLMRQFGQRLTCGVVPTAVLKQFVKSAAFFMILTRESKRIPFKNSPNCPIRRAVMILVLQAVGKANAAKKSFKTLFPKQPIPDDILSRALSFYHTYLLHERFVPTNSENESFVIEMGRIFLESNPAADLKTALQSLFNFVDIKPSRDTLLIPQLNLLFSIAYFESLE